MRKLSLTFLTMVLLVGVVHAQSTTVLIDYQGYAWETGGFPPSNPGDALEMVGVVDDLDPLFGVNIPTVELTLHNTGLLSTGAVAFGGGFFGINYVGGNIELYEDATPDYDFGINPPNITAPATFANGTLFLGGFFTSFFLFFDINFGVGSYEGFITWTAGTALATVQGLQADAFTFGGVLDTNASGGAVPQGYDLQIDGTIEAEIVVAVEDKSWGQIKALYNNR